MTHCIIQAPQLFPDEHLNISGPLSFCFRVCAAVIIIMAISPSLNSKITRKKRRKSLFRVSERKPRCVGYLFVWSLNRTACPHQKSSPRRGLTQLWLLTPGLFKSFPTPRTAITQHRRLLCSVAAQSRQNQTIFVLLKKPIIFPENTCVYFTKSPTQVEIKDTFWRWLENLPCDVWLTLFGWVWAPNITERSEFLVFFSPLISTRCS